MKCSGSEPSNNIETVSRVNNKINANHTMQQERLEHDLLPKFKSPAATTTTTTPTTACQWSATCRMARRLAYPISSFMYILFIVNALIVVSTNLLVRVNCLLDEADEAKCFNCMRNVTQLMGVDGNKRCEEYLCGPYQISYRYWTEAGKPGSRQDARDFERCVRDRNCAEQTIKAYFRKYKRDCNNDGQIDCLDMASLHKGGPSSCSTDWFFKSRYWSAFNKTMCSPSNRALEEASKAGLEAPSADIAPKRLIKSNETLTPECLDCICDAVSGCNLSNTNCSGGTVCGPYSISQAYWKDGRRPGASWTACAKTKECSSVAMRNYMEKNKKDCNGDGVINCEDYAAIHKAGPRACSNRNMQRDPYWNKFLSCRAGQAPIKDVSMVKVGETPNTLSSRQPIVETPIGTLEGLARPANAPADVFAPPINYQQQAASSTRATSSTIKYNVAYNTDSKDTTQQQSKNKETSSHLAKPQANVDDDFYAKPTRSNHEAPSTTTTSRLPYSSQSWTLDTLASHATYRPTTIQMWTTSQPASEFASSPQPPTVKIDEDETLVTELPEETMPLIVVTSPSPHSSSTQSQRSSTEHQSKISTLPVTSSIEPSNPSRINQQHRQQQPAQRPPLDSSNKQSEKASSEPSWTSDFDNVVSGIMQQPDFVKSIPDRARVPPERPPLVTSSQTNKMSAGPSGVFVSNHANNSSPTSGHEQATDTKKTTIDQRSSVNRQPAVKPTEDPDSLKAAYAATDLNDTSPISNDCLECICDASSNCDTSVQCISKQREKNRCGLYMISWNQYQDSDIRIFLPFLSGIGATLDEQPNEERSYHECSMDKSCAEKLIHLYIEKHQKDCNNDGKFDCFDIAAIHRVGPNNCNSAKLIESQYWKDFNTCYTTDKMTTIQPEAHAQSTQSLFVEK